MVSAKKWMIRFFAIWVCLAFLLACRSQTRIVAVPPAQAVYFNGVKQCNATPCMVENISGLPDRHKLRVQWEEDESEVKVLLDEEMNLFAGYLGWLALGIPYLFAWELADEYVVNKPKTKTK